MIYEAYQAHADLLSPPQMVARAVASWLGHGLFGQGPWSPLRRLAADWELFSRVRLTHHRPEFGISAVQVGGQTLPVREEVVQRTPFATLLRFEGQGGGGAGQQAAHPDGFAGFVAIAVIASIDAGNRLLDFLEQLALAVARAQLQGVLFLDGGAIGRVGHDHGVFAQVLGGLARIAQDVLLELDQLEAEIGHLHIVHVLVIGHGEHFGIAQLLNRLVFPVVGEFGVFFDGSGGNRQDRGAHGRQECGFGGR